jgi:hypothetical protein
VRTIWKHEVKVGDDPTILLHDDARIIRVGSQSRGVVTFWEEHSALGDNKVLHHFEVFGTGHRIPDGFEYVGSVDDGPFVWHLYEEK